MAARDAKRSTDGFLDALCVAYDVERHMVQVLPRLAQTAADEHLRTTLEVHLEETRGHVARLEAVFRLLGGRRMASPKSSVVEVFEPDGGDVPADRAGTPTNDARLIAACQRIEQYEIASYRKLLRSANTLGLLDAAALLEQTLEEEEYTHAALSEALTSGACASTAEAN